MKPPTDRIGRHVPGLLRFGISSRRSRIDGRGAFADQAIPARRKLGEIGGVWTSIESARHRAATLQRIAVIELDDDVALDATDSTHPLRFLNHHCQANAYMRICAGKVEIYSLRPILAGEEITLHYGPTHHDGRLACACGSTGCTRFL